MKLTTHEKILRRILRLSKTSVMYLDPETRKPESSNGYYVPMIDQVLVYKDSRSTTLSHEMFHAWQNKRSNMWLYKNVKYVNHEDSYWGMRKYRYQRVEVEANIFALAYSLLTGEFKDFFNKLCRETISFFCYFLYGQAIVAAFQSFPELVNIFNEAVSKEKTRISKKIK